jgi:hypothetical protein
MGSIIRIVEQFSQMMWKMINLGERQVRASVNPIKDHVSDTMQQLRPSAPLKPFEEILRIGSRSSSSAAVKIGKVFTPSSKWNIKITDQPVATF